MHSLHRQELLFRDPALQAAFGEQGFVKLPLLSAGEADRLARYYRETRGRHETVSHLHHTTTDTQDTDLIWAVDREIKAVLEPALHRVMAGFRPLVATFHVKEPGAGSATGIHQDPTFVDEDLYDSANVWVALQDTDTHNGNLFFVKGSHRIRALRITPECPNYYDTFRDQLGDLAVQVPLRKGEAVVFKNATIHGATENASGDIRLASTLLLCSQQAEWLLYYREREPDAPIEKYVLDLEAFVAMAKNGRPDRRVYQGTVPYNFPQLTKAEFLARTRPAAVLPGSYWQRVRNFFLLKTA